MCYSVLTIETFHRIIEWLGLEGTPKINKFQTRATGRAASFQIRY